MPFSPKTLEEKPYNICVSCAHIGKKCDGPNFLAMSIERWCEWCRLRKDYLDITSAELSTMAGVAKISVDRVMSGNIKDLRISTMQSITKALVNGTWGQYPCALSMVENDPETIARAEKAEAECERLRAELTAAHNSDQSKINHLREQIKFDEEQVHEKDKLLAERYEFIKRKDRVITMLAGALTVAILVIITALIIDVINPSVGFFWLK